VIGSLLEQAEQALLQDRIGAVPQRQRIGQYQLLGVGDTGNPILTPQR
jgi:hypothetical protein